MKLPYPIDTLLQDIVDQFTDLFEFNKTATVIVVAVSFLLGALLF